MRISRNRYYARLRKRRRNTVVAIVCLSLVTYGSVRLVSYFADSMHTRQTNEEIRTEYESSMQIDDLPLFTSDESVTTSSGSMIPEEAVVTIEPTLLQTYQVIGNNIQPSMQKIYERNKDVVGWIDISGVLSLPVVYRDNKYYLNHDINGKSSRAGTLFLDERHPLKPKTQHLVIHGHDMVDGSMFGLLIHYRNARYIHEHGIINFNTLFQDERYVIFAVLLVSEDIHSPDYFPYTGTPTFSSSAEFKAFINEARKRSMYDIDIDVEPYDAILTLSTCLNDKRVLVMYRRVRKYENDNSLLEALNTVIV